VKDYLTPDLDPLGKRIIECFQDGGKLADYRAFAPSEWMPQLDPKPAGV
jgi:hypothetical protein